MKGFIFAPASARTAAEQYSPQYESYQYSGLGGQSWAVPYVAGVLALGWQIDPELSNDDILELLFESAYTDSANNKIINPGAFIKAIMER
jgi:subtilisin family serine protease